MHEQCMQLNVWLLIEIQIENTLGLMNEKSNSLKSHGVGDVRHPLKTDGFVSAADNFCRHNALRFTLVPFRLEPNSVAKRTVF